MTMLFSCAILHDFRSSIVSISEVGLKWYIISTEHITQGDLDNNFAFTIILLICKKAIYNAMKKGNIAQKQNVNCEISIVLFNRKIQSKYHRQTSTFQSTMGINCQLS